MDIKYKLIYAKRKSIGIRIAKDGEIIVRAPQGVPKKEIEQVVKAHSAWIIKNLNKAKEKSEIYNLSPEEDTALRALARKTTTELVAKYSAKMGLSPNKITITSARGRFGSCSSKGNISFSKYLMLYPIEAIEYVAVHELCHLKHMNHSSAFYALVEKHLPDWKERKSKLSHAYIKSPTDILNQYK